MSCPAVHPGVGLPCVRGGDGPLAALHPLPHQAERKVTEGCYPHTDVWLWGPHPWVHDLTDYPTEPPELETI